MGEDFSVTKKPLSISARVLLIFLGTILFVFFLFGPGFYFNSTQGPLHFRFLQNSFLIYGTELLVKFW